MEKNEKLVWSGLAILVVCLLIGYLVAPFNQNFAIMILYIGTVAIGMSLGVIFTECDICTPAKRRNTSWEDEFYACAEFDDVARDLDVEAGKVERVCNALEKIATVEGAGSFDACDIMACAVDFRERAHELRHRSNVLVKARDNRKFDGIKELVVNYSSEPMFRGLRDTVRSYLPESFQKPMYLDVDERLCEIYNKLSSLCDEQK